MKSEDRKAAVAAYKERKVEPGIYAVRCRPSGQIWVGGAPDLATIRNRLWFTLRMGSNTHRSLQEAWAAHGAEAFAFDILERLDEEEIGYVRDRLLKEAVARWVEELGAVRI
jgi:hypothetical protein